MRGQFHLIRLKGARRAVRLMPGEASLTVYADDSMQLGQARSGSVCARRVPSRGDKRKVALRRKEEHETDCTTNSRTGLRSKSDNGNDSTRTDKNAGPHL